MKAIITKQVSNAKNYSGDKETVSTYVVLARRNGEMREVVRARAYMGRSSRSSVVYASIWVSYDNVYTSGTGTAGGGGFHKESAAFQDAISSAGIELYGSPYTSNYSDAETRAAARKVAKQRAYIGGVGESAMREAFLAIARAAGAKGKLTIVGA